MHWKLHLIHMQRRILVYNLFRTVWSVFFLYWMQSVYSGDFIFWGGEGGDKNIALNPQIREM